MKHRLIPGHVHVGMLLRDYILFQDAWAMWLWLRDPCSADEKTEA